MKRTIFLSVFLIVILLIACGPKKADKNSFIINGKFTNTKKDSIYLIELLSDKSNQIDSAIFSEVGTFSFKVKPKEIGFYILKINRNNFTTLLIDKGETIEITADAKQMQRTYAINGSLGSSIIKEHVSHLQSNYDKVDSLKNVFMESQNKDNFIEIKKTLDSIYEKIVTEQKIFSTKLIEKNINSLACLIVIYQSFGRETIFNLNNKNDVDIYNKLDKALTINYPDNPHTRNFHERILEFKKIENEKLNSEKQAELKFKEGMSAPDFTLEDIEGKKVSLSSFKGKYVLIDFWASWCAPCRQENPRLVKLYKQYKSKNFTILGVSLDDKKSLWTKSIKEDKLSWTQVSDLSGWQSPVVELYHIQSIPYSVFIDKQGRIICKGLRGDSLDAAIAKEIK